MIELGFTNWIACEAENRDDASSEHGTSVSVSRGDVGWAGEHWWDGPARCPLVGDGCVLG